MNRWLPGVIRDPLADAGTFVGLEPYCGILHTTEGKTYRGARSAYVANNSAPHFTVSFETGAFRAVQHIALDRAGRALKNKSGGVETNRRRCIQIEIVGFADAARARSLGGLYVADFPGRYLNALAELMRAIEVETGIAREGAKLRSYPASYGLSNGVRFSFEAWRRWRGWCGHQHVPENDHGDPGALDLAYLLNNVAPPVSEEDILKGYRWIYGGAIWVTFDGRHRRRIDGEGLPAYERMTIDLGEQHAKFHDDFIDETAAA